MEAVLRTVSSAPTYGSLGFSGAVQPGGGDCKFLATVEFGLDTYEVELEMIHPYRRDMLGFFEEIGRNAHRGWPGNECWRSEFGELRICAASEGGGSDVDLKIRMCWPPNYDEAWSGTLVVEAEAVEQFSQRMRDFLRLDHGSRFRSVPRKL